MRNFNSLNQFELQNVFFTHESASSGSGKWIAQRSSTKINADFFNRAADVLAKDLIGRIVETKFNGKVTSGIITETAAYTGSKDPQSHEYKIRKNGEPVNWQSGCLYIYSTQGNTMLTVAAAPFKDGSTVLIRALEPLEGIDVMQERSQADLAKITIGPGNLSKALGLSVEQNGHNALAKGSQIIIKPGFVITAEQIREAKRKGDKNDAPLLRFFRNDSDGVS
jgi:DNA-3-methyladenine glycosylase